MLFMVTSNRCVIPRTHYFLFIVRKQNVLIGDDGTPRVCDFGRSRLIDHRGFTTTNHGLARYMAPELFAVPDQGQWTGDTQPIEPHPLSKESDVYAYAMVAYLVSSAPPRSRRRCTASSSGVWLRSSFSQHLNGSKYPHQSTQWTSARMASANRTAGLASHRGWLESRTSKQTHYVPSRSTSCPTLNLK